MMRDSFYLASSISASTKKIISEIIEAEVENFGSLVQLSGLNPSSDFRYANLDNVKFDNSDLRGFDFTGASLRYTSWKNVKWDSTTIILNADIEGTDLLNDEDLDRRDGAVDSSILREHWGNIIIWMDGLKAGNADHRENMGKLLHTFFQAKDTFVRRHALTTLTKYMGIEEFIILIRESVFESNQKRLVGPAFALLDNFYSLYPQKITSFVVTLMRGRYAVEASIFLAAHLETQKSLDYLITLVSRNENVAVRKRFIASLASRHGEVVSVVARSPLEGDAFDFGAKIDPRTIALIRRAVLRTASDEVNQLRAQRNFSEYLAMTHNNIEFAIIRILRELNKARLGWSIPKDKEMYDYQVLREKLLREKNPSLWLP